jgi:hypothetical protein
VIGGGAGAHDHRACSVVSMWYVIVDECVKQGGSVGDESNAMVRAA